MMNARSSGHYATAEAATGTPARRQTGSEPFQQGQLFREIRGHVEGVIQFAFVGIVFEIEVPFVSAHVHLRIAVSFCSAPILRPDSPSFSR
jgi:hypothetical protein